MAELGEARLAPKLVLLRNGDVWVRGGSGTWDGGANRRRQVRSDERWVAATGECRAEARRALPPPDAVAWDAEAGKLVPLTRWPGRLAVGRLDLGGGSSLTLGRCRDVDAGRFGRRPEVTDELTLETPRGRQQLHLSQARAEATLTHLRDGRVAVSGGYEVGMDYSWEDVYEGTAAVDIVDPRTGTVRQAATLAVPRYRHAVIEVAPGRLLVAGGTRKDDFPCAAVELIVLR